MRVVVFLACFAAAIALAFVVYPEGYPQDLRYHQFADTRSWAGIPNTLNVVSNLGFLAVALWSAAAMPPLWKAAARTFILGIFLTSIGSAYYHLHPSNATLPWDRLGMAIAFMALLAILIERRITPRAPLLWLAGLEVFGIASVIVTRVDDDLRLYGVAQYFPVLVLVVLIEGWLWAAAAAYLIAKLCELLDRQIFHALHETISGHTLKHLFAAAGIYFIWRWVSSRAKSRDPLIPRENGPMEGIPRRLRGSE